MKNRFIEEAKYIINNNATIRETAKEYKVSKSLVHKEIHTKLKKYDYDLYKQVLNILYEHNINKHLIGGLHTKEKYKRA